MWAFFGAYADVAFAQAEQHPKRVILLGVTPDSPEDSYGWIEPGTPLAPSPAFEVRGFREKPSRRVAARLMRGGSLWNSFVMVGRVSAFLEMMRRSLPDLVRSFDSMWAAVTPGMEASAPRAHYARILLRTFRTRSSQCVLPILLCFPRADLGGAISAQRALLALVNSGVGFDRAAEFDDARPAVYA